MSNLSHSIRCMKALSECEIDKYLVEKKSKGNLISQYAAVCKFVWQIDSNRNLKIDGEITLEHLRQKGCD